MKDKIFDNDFEQELNVIFEEMEENHKQEQESHVRKKYIVVGKGAQKAIEEYEKEIKDSGDILYIYKKEPQKTIKSFVRDADIVILIAALGGVTGKKYIAEVAKVLQTQDVFTIALLIEPLLSEGRTKLIEAEECLEKVNELVHCIIPIQMPNGYIENENLLDLNEQVVQCIFMLNDTLDTAQTFDHGMDKFKMLLEQAEYLKMYSVILENKKADVDDIIDAIYDCSTLQLNMEDAKVAIVTVYGGHNMDPQDIIEIQYNIEGMLEDKAELFFCTMINEQSMDYYEIDILLSAFNPKKKNKLSNSKRIGKNKLNALKNNDKDKALMNALSLSQLCINLLLQNETIEKKEILQQLEKMRKDLKKLSDIE